MRGLRTNLNTLSRRNGCVVAVIAVVPVMAVMAVMLGLTWKGSNIMPMMAAMMTAMMGMLNNIVVAVVDISLLAMEAAVFVVGVGIGGVGAHVDVYSGFVVQPLAASSLLCHRTEHAANRNQQDGNENEDQSHPRVPVHNAHGQEGQRHADSHRQRKDNLSGHTF